MVTEKQTARYRVRPIYWDTTGYTTRLYLVYDRAGIRYDYQGNLAPNYTLLGRDPGLADLRAWFERLGVQPAEWRLAPPIMADDDSPQADTYQAHLLTAHWLPAA